MAERGNGAAAEGGPHPPQGSPSDALDLKARLDRFGEIFGRGLDLAEAGMTLGLTVLGTLGAAAQTKIIERILHPAAEGAAGEPARSQASAPAAPAGTGENAAYGITNRLPLNPGGTVSISFSVNNESSVASKHVRLAVEAFSGERTGAVLPPDCLGVSPGERVIAPMDFEKFVLEGRIPVGLAADRYRGSVMVLGEGPMRIPVLLVVEAST
ncbi:MAG: hypothetical protein ACREFP_12460 [Acetobacteraceae bacterium]